MSLGEVDETVVAKLVIAHLTFVESTKSLVIAFMALFLFVAVSFKKNKLGLGIIIRDSTI